MKRLPTIAKVTIVLAIVIVAVFASLWEVNYRESAPIQLAPTGWGESDCNVQCSLAFYTATGGGLTASWQTDNPLSPGNSTAALYASAPSGALLGPPEWTGAPNASTDSMAVHVGTGTYTLEWTVPRSQSPFSVTLLSPLTIDPPAPFPWL